MEQRRLQSHVKSAGTFYCLGFQSNCISLSLNKPNSNNSHLHINKFYVVLVKSS